MSAQGLWVDFVVSGRTVRVIDDAEIELWPGKTTGLIGDSGSGKSTLALALLGLTGSGGSSGCTRLEFAGESLVGLTEEQWRAYRGRRIGLITQHPRRALNPTRTVGDQIVSHYRAHTGDSRPAAVRATRDLLSRVGFRDVGRVFRLFPHELSGGMAQRALIALALSPRPSLLIADEPTTALDPTTQRGVLDLLEELKASYDLAVLLVSHNTAVIDRYCENVYQMVDRRPVPVSPAGEHPAQAAEPAR
jgi:ABC-type dipeptide/oligopeptide/nickel transport system ATPase component